MVPSIEKFAEGSFTAPDARQTSYFIKSGECFAETRAYEGTYRLAIFEGPRLVASVDPKVVYAGVLDTEPNGLAAVADVEGDGLDELLLTAIGFGQGELNENAWLVDVRGGELHILKEFDDVYDNPCSARVAERDRVKASVITYSGLLLLVENYEAPCKASVYGNVPALKDFRRVRGGSK